MNIVVYCGASVGNHEIFVEAAKSLARWIAKNGHTLIYGGGKAGLMGVLADEVLLHNGKVIGIIPNFLVDRELSHPRLNYIALPGGPGTLEEISEAISWARIGQHQNPCILFNVGGYYDKLKEFYDVMVENGFLSEADKKAMLFTDSITEIEQFIMNFSPLPVRTYK